MHRYRWPLDTLQLCLMPTHSQDPSTPRSPQITYNLSFAASSNPTQYFSSTARSFAFFRSGGSLENAALILSTTPLIFSARQLHPHTEHTSVLVPQLLNLTLIRLLQRLARLQNLHQQVMVCDMVRL